MTTTEIIRTLLHHRQLAEKRDIMHAQNRFAKFMMGLASLLVLMYLMFFAVMTSLIVNGDKTTTALEFAMSIMPILLLVDFCLRWFVQQTPSQIVKPYMLLPLPRHACVDAFILRSILNWGNAIWLAFLMPYCLMSVVFSYGVWACLLLLSTFMLLIFANSQWYAIAHALIARSQIWWLLPIFVYAAIFSPIYIYGVPDLAAMERFGDIYGYLGTLMEYGNIAPILFSAILLASLIAINRKVQYSCIMGELCRTERKRQISDSKRLDMLNRFGEIGEYLKLEIRSITRNKNLRKSFFSATSGVVVITLVCSFSDIYDGFGMSNFWCLYNLVIYAAMLLMRVMCNEGNYIEALMIRRENILALLHAKYIFFCALLALPCLLLLPTVITGKWPAAMIASYALFTAGFQHFLILQMAVYNKTTTPLNTKFTSKNGLGNNYFQLMTSMAILFIPIILVSTLNAFFTENTVYAIMAAIGLAFIATCKLWMRNIYKRMMKRRYKNMEGFRCSR